MKKTALSIFLLLAMYAIGEGQILTPEHLCNSALSFMTEMRINNFQNFMSKESAATSKTFYGKSFKSSTNFFTAESTVIEDTSEARPYRQAHIRYLTTETQTLDLDMALLKVYQNLIEICDPCLSAHNFTHFEKINGAHDREMNYYMDLPNPDAKLTNYLMMKIYIDITRVEQGVYYQYINIHFSII